jgi:hypothetical protein
MQFFNKKEEVIDIQLTQFGKHLLSVGAFRPVYYCFFDDDILYDTTKAGFAEHQNSAEKRILEETPKLKTQYLSYSVEEKYILEDNLIKENKKNKFSPINRNVDPSLQERILLYPLREQESSKQKLPKFEIETLKGEFSKPATFYHLTASGIVKKLPQLFITEEAVVKRVEKPLAQPPRMLNSEVFIDLLAPEIEFLDGSKIIIEEKEIIFDIQELNTFYGLDNFNIEIFEVREEISAPDVLVRIDDIDEINRLFHIKTDEHVTDHRAKSLRERNYYRRNE